MFTRNNLVKITGICGLALSSSSVMAIELINDDTTKLNFEGEAILAGFTSDKSYDPFGFGVDTTGGGADWSEGYLKFGLSGERTVDFGSFYGSAKVIGSFTAGDGDAAGFTTGDEFEFTEDELFVGFKNDLFDISFGRQNYIIGDGFIVAGDALNLGEGLDFTEIDFDRGGAYWLAARRTFQQALVVKVGGETGPRAEAFYLKSDNAGQANSEFTGFVLEYTADYGTFGLTFLQGLDTDSPEAVGLGITSRDGQSTTSLRFQGNAGVENLFLSAEFANQSQGDVSDAEAAAGEFPRPDATAGYVEAGWTFATTPWAPTVGFRVSAYEDGYDALFNGFTRGYGTWFQGEVAGNYAGPFNTNSTITHLSVKANPTDLLTLGASLFTFSADEGNLSDGNELNVWAEYVAMTPFMPGPIIFSPLVGFYTPDDVLADGGTQIDDDDTNFYAQILAVVPF